MKTFWRACNRLPIVGVFGEMAYAVAHGENYLSDASHHLRYCGSILWHIFSPFGVIALWLATS